MNETDNNNESKNNVRRLALALRLQVGPEELSILSRALNYDPNQLIQDIRDFYDQIFEKEE